MLNRFLLIFIFSVLVTSCGLLDRGGRDDELAELETIPDEPITQEPSILIDDEEMIAPVDGAIVDDGSVPRTQQMEAGPSGTFVGQKINPLREDFNSCTLLVTLICSLDCKDSPDSGSS